MTDNTAPPPHLLKKFSNQARDETSKRNGAGYLKTFAKLCIEWANSISTPDPSEIRSSEIQPPPELVKGWAKSSSIPGTKTTEGQWQQRFARQAAQWGADQELEACCVLMDKWGLDGPDLRECRRPNPLSLKEQALAVLDDSANRLDGAHENIIRRALEALDD